MSLINKVQFVSVDNIQFQIANNEYVNLTKMCKVNGSRLDNYFSNKGTKDYLKALEVSLNLSLSELIIKRVGGTPTEQGTYAHPLIAIHLGQWISPEFALTASNLVHKYLTADVTLATDILDRATPEQVNAQGQQLANVLIEKADEKLEGHIQARLNTKTTNRELNRALAGCPNVSRGVFAMAQDSIYKAVHGKTVKSLKKERGLVKKDDSIRDTLTTKELVHLAFCESMSADVLDTTKPSGDINCSKSVYDTSKQVKDFAKRLVKVGSSK
jgi:KilA-N domain